MRKAILGLFLIASIVAVTTSAHAQSAVKFRPHLEMNLFSLDAGRVKTEAPTPIGTVTTKEKFVSPQFGIGRSDAGTFPYTAPFGVGFGVSINDMIVVGARFSLAYQQDNGEIETEGAGASASADQGAQKLFFFSLIPYFEFVFIPTGPIRPFVTAQIGFQAARYKIDPPNGPETSEGPNLFIFGAGGGAHFFLAPSFSIDATLMMSIGAGRIVEEPDNMVDDNVFRFQLQTLVGLSGWF